MATETQLSRIEKKLDAIISTQNTQNARLAVLEVKEDNRTWFDRVIVGAWIAVIVGGVAAAIHIKGQ
jgi:hypothetical protein